MSTSPGTAPPRMATCSGRKYKLVIRRTYQQAFQRAAARAGLPPEFIPHSMRHLYASVALAEGIPITEVSRWLGHNSIEVTRQIYGHLIPSSFHRARATLDTFTRRAKSSPAALREPAGTCGWRPGPGGLRPVPAWTLTPCSPFA